MKGPLNGGNSMYNWIQNYTKLEYLTEEEPYDFGFAAENRPRSHSRRLL